METSRSDGVASTGVHIVLRVLSSRCCMASAAISRRCRYSHWHQRQCCWDMAQSFQRLPPTRPALLLSCPPENLILPHTQPAQNFTSQDKRQERRPYHLAAIDRSKVAAVERIFRLRQHENLVRFECPTPFPDRQNALLRVSFLARATIFPSTNTCVLKRQTTLPDTAKTGFRSHTSAGK